MQEDPIEFGVIAFKMAEINDQRFFPSIVKAMCFIKYCFPMRYQYIQADPRFYVKIHPVLAPHEEKEQVRFKHFYTPRSKRRTQLHVG